jgi:hypothetical protein
MASYTINPITSTRFLSSELIAMPRMLDNEALINYSTPEEGRI